MAQGCAPPEAASSWLFMMFLASVGEATTKAKVRKSDSTPLKFVPDVTFFAQFARFKKKITTMTIYEIQ